MFNFLSSCGFCSNLPSPGQYALETFKKVPAVGGLLGNLSSLTNLSNIANSLGGLGGIGNISGIANNFGNFGGIGNLIGGGGQRQNSGGNGNVGGFDLSKFINNVPTDSLKADQSNFNDLVQKNPDAVVKKVLKSNYNDLINEYKQNGQKFTDPQFPPDQRSIGNVEDLSVKATWKRIPDIIKRPEFVSGKIQPADILQGSLGDCYFLSAIAALAENDFRIKNLFPNLQINPNGIYMARILHEGVLKEVVVDDYVPVSPRGDQPLFAKPAGGKQIWVMILQKCWAKLNGSYGAIVGGLPNEVLHAFSGAPTFYHNVPTTADKQDELWNDMWGSYEKGAILCCGTKGQDDVEKYGFVKGHAYTILNLYTSPTRMLKVRNPWGQKQWQGRASDNDTAFWSKIPAAQKQKMGYCQKNDGVFFMLWDDFVNYFDMVDVCKINDNANYTNVDTEFEKKNGNMFEFQTSKNANVTVALSQQSLRGASEAVEKKGYARTTLIVARQDDASKGYEYKYIDSSSSRLFSENYLQLPNLEKGKYVIFAKCDWINNNPDTATVSLYTDSPSHLILSKQSKHDKFLYKVFLDHARKNSKKQVLSQSPNEWICSDFLLRESGYGYLAFHLDEKSQRKIGVQLKESDYTDRRLILKKPYKGQGTIKTTVEPGKELIILFRMKSTNYPSTLTLPTPKIYNLV